MSCSLGWLRRDLAPPLYDFQVFEKCCPITPQSSFLKAKYAQLFQSFFIRFGFQPPDHPYQPPLNLFQFVSILLEVWCPELDTELKMRPNWCQIEGNKYLVGFGVYTSINAA